MTSVTVLNGGSLSEGDTNPNLRVKCFDKAGNPFNLDGYTVNFAMRRSDADSTKVDEQLTIDDANIGIVEYNWSATDTDTAGTYDAQIVADDGSGDVISFPNDRYFNIYITEKL